MCRNNLQIHLGLSKCFEVCILNKKRITPDILLKSNMKAAMRAVLMVRMVMVYVRTDR